GSVSMAGIQCQFQLMSPEIKYNAAVQIAGIGCYVPERRITNEHWEKLAKTSSDWILKNVGIQERSRIGANETTADMGVAAARDALKMAGVSADRLDWILC